MSGLRQRAAAALDPTVRAPALDRIYETVTAERLLEFAITHEFADEIALVSSFGAESAVLLHMAARIDRALPVLFLETGMLFPETLAYQQELADRLGLTNVRLVRPDPIEAAVQDADGALHVRDADACCALRKVRPLERALGPYRAWVTGRKRFQGGARTALSRIEAGADGRIKLNPLADWDAARLRAYMAEHDLPPHPLVAKGYPSLGCLPCTSQAGPGEDPRSGRWRGAEKAECGIHFVNGRAVRAPMGV